MRTGGVGGGGEKWQATSNSMLRESPKIKCRRNGNRWTGGDWRVRRRAKFVVTNYLYCTLETVKGKA